MAKNSNTLTTTLLSNLFLFENCITLLNWITLNPLFPQLLPPTKSLIYFVHALKFLKTQVIAGCWFIIYE